MRIGVFSDDGAGLATAMLIGRGLASVGERVDVSAFGQTTVPGCSHAGDDFLSVLSPSVAPIDMLAAHGNRKGHLVVVLPLEGLAERQTRKSLDVALTVGRDHPASARALRAARYEVGAYGGGHETEGQGIPPVWFVPAANQVELWTKATLASSGSVKLPFATRSIPFMTPRLEEPEVACLTAGDPRPAMLQASLLLTSIVVALAVDPHARRIDADTVAELMAVRRSRRERRTSDLLLGLASEFERLEGLAEETMPRHLQVPAYPSRRDLRTPYDSPRSRRRRPGSLSKRVRLGAR